MKKIATSIVLLLLANSANAETLNEKVARNAANCLVGHIATESSKYQSGQTSEYIQLIESILGSEAGYSVIESSNKKLNSAVRMLGSSKTEEGSFLISKFCPSIDQILEK